jgi:hypothetical protein
VPVPVQREYHTVRQVFQQQTINSRAPTQVVAGPTMQAPIPVSGAMGATAIHPSRFGGAPVVAGPGFAGPGFATAVRAF